MNEEKMDGAVILCPDDRIIIMTDDRRTLEFVPKAKYDDLLRRIKEAAEEIEYSSEGLRLPTRQTKASDLYIIYKHVPEAKEVQDDTD